MLGIHVKKDEKICQINIIVSYYHSIHVIICIFFEQIKKKNIYFAFHALKNTHAYSFLFQKTKDQNCIFDTL